VKSPLLENVDLKGARGVLVNITADDSLTLDEYYEVMNTIQSFTAEEATVIVGTAFDAAMGENLRVTMVATGLGNPVNGRQQKPTVVVNNEQQKATGTYDAIPASMPGQDDFERPTIWRNRRTADSMDDAGIDSIDIPAFLRKQAD
jgi:cell division protein FtsZ